MIEIKRILHPTDFSEHSNLALRFAISFAMEYNAKLFLLHVVEDIGSALYFDLLQSPPLTQLLADMEEHARKELSRLLPEEARGRVEAEEMLRHGAPFVEIIRAAAELNVDLIVMGTHGRSGLKHALFGSVAEKVVRKAPCPVLTVPHPKHKFEMP